ncbi:MAG: biopolymer transporter ExbD [Planctomycetota bacterium]|nr:biopolymer transporter ExbD [Planctomycetota bacterium]
MRIRVKPSRRRPDRITLNLASMIDVTFLLLIYFLVTTVLAKQEDRLSPTLQTESESASGELSDFQPQIVKVMNIDGAPGYQLGPNVFRTKEDLARTLGGLPKTAGVFIHVHNDLPVGFAVAAIQAARDAGFDQVTYVPAK